MRWVKAMKGDVCVWWGRRKKKGKGYMGDGEKIKEIKKKKEMGSGEWGVGYTCIVGKKRVWKKKEENKIKREKTKLVLFVCSLYLVQSVKL
jgi:hypothetical protein